MFVRYQVTVARALHEALRLLRACLIRRAAIVKAFQNDPTTYTLADLAAQSLDSKSAEGEHIRSFQMMARRLEERPALARILIYKSGPLSDYPDSDITAYAGVFARGIEEVSEIVSPIVVRPG